MPDGAINRTAKRGLVRADNIVLAGHPFAPIGMGEHVRSSFRAFQIAGMNTKIKDIYAISKRDDPAYEQEFGDHLTSRLSPELNIFHINGDEIEQAIPHLNDENFSKAYNVIYPAWELSKYPDVWARQLERFDEVWAPSAFIRDAIASAVDRPVIHMPLAVEVQSDAFMGRRHFAIPESAFVFLFFFDFSSYMERKNPFAMLDAFLKLVDRIPSAPLHCLLKFKGGAEGHPDHARLFKILSARNDRIQIITRDLSDAEVKSLVRCADCFVSLHRSEGFGRGVAEAMTLGRAAIATGYSGNMDFMTPETSFIVDHQLVPVGKGAYPHWRGQVWADPSVEHASRLMEQVFSEPLATRAKGGAARLHMRTNFSARAIGVRYLTRIQELCAQGSKV